MCSTREDFLFAAKAFLNDHQTCRAILPKERSKVFVPKELFINRNGKKVLHRGFTVNENKLNNFLMSLLSVRAKT
jgi:hypothetical protein